MGVVTTSKSRFARRRFALGGAVNPGAAHVVAVLWEGAADTSAAAWEGQQ